MSKITFTTAFNRTVKSIRDVNVQKFTEPSKVKESLAYCTDINKIYEKYVQTGKLPLNGQHPIYDENFVNYDSLIDAQKIIGSATEYFSGLPAKIKSKYGNSLEKFVYALNNGDQFLIDEGVLQLSTQMPIKEDIKPDVEFTSVQPQTPATDVVNTATTD